MFSLRTACFFLNVFSGDMSKISVHALAMYLGGNVQATAKVNARAFRLMINTCLGGGFEIEYDF